MEAASTPLFPLLMEITTSLLMSMGLKNAPTTFQRITMNEQYVILVDRLNCVGVP